MWVCFFAVKVPMAELLGQVRVPLSSVQTFRASFELRAVYGT